MRILFIAPSPPNSMSRIRTQNIIKAMQSLGHEVTLLSFVYSKSDLVEIDRCKEYIKNVFTVEQPKWKSIMNCAWGLILPVPLRVQYCHSKKFKLTLESIIKGHDFDLVYIKRLRMAQYAKVSKELGVQTIIDITDSLTKYYDRIRAKEHGIKKLLAIEEFYKHRLYEPRICKNSPPIIICSESDKEYLVNISQELAPNIHVMHNSIETSEWRTEVHHCAPVGHRNKLVFFGMMDYAPNIIAARFLITEVMPLLPSCYSLELVGANCGNELRSLENERIHFTGFVEDMREALQKNDLFICPILAGSGVKNKILQASLAGLPIVSTNLGVEGIDSSISNYVFIADTPMDIAQTVLRINEMPEKELINRIAGQQKIIMNDNDSVAVLKKCFEDLGINYE